MSDLTAMFDALLTGHSAPPTKRPSATTSDKFLQEAHDICTLVVRLHTQLCELRQAYLSTAAPRKTHIRAHSASGPSHPVSLTDRDREEIDAKAKMTISRLNARIRELEDAEQLRQSSETALLHKRFARGFGALGAWAAGSGAGSGKSREQLAAEGALRQLGAHRESVIWFLRQRLQETTRTQKNMMETRLTREMEKNRSVLANARGPLMNSGRGSIDLGRRRSSSTSNNTTHGGLGLPGEEGQRPPPLENITEEQRQMFEKGNQDMLKHYESTLDKVRTAEKSLVEISELQNLLVNNLATQSAHIDQLVAESFETTEGVGKGNKELKKSVNRASPARYTFFAATGLCAFLVLWDLII
ncbi:hypothetical protein QBC39DRAFT_257946 [Podospora conica]|nr:hypothetical protein QBC39DRAFT_257946 [Schizothecium conicum]